MDMDHHYVHCNNPDMDEEMKLFFDQFDAEMPYDPNDGVNDQFDPDAFMFTHEDEQPYKDDWTRMAHDHIEQYIYQSKAPFLKRVATPSVAALLFPGISIGHGDFELALVCTLLVQFQHRDSIYVTNILS
jgi:hypothetical protein